jgi:hypothetical protein
MNCLERRERADRQLVQRAAFKQTAFFLLIRSSSRARSAELVSPNLFSSAIAHLQVISAYEHFQTVDTQAWFSRI